MAESIALNPPQPVGSPSDKSLCPQPVGFPPRLTSLLAWHPKELLAKRDQTILELQPSDLVEIKAAVAHFNESGVPLHALSPVNFPLPRLSQRFEVFRANLYDGVGLFTIRGLQPAELSPEDNAIVHIGLASHFGNKRALQQNWGQTTGEALLHVSDIKKTTQEGVFLAPGNLSIAMSFHSDPGDVVSLYCRQMPADGGELYLASGWAIYNELLAKHPDAVQVLSEPWVWQESRTGDFEVRSKTQPLFYFYKGKLVVNFQRRPFVDPAHEPRDPRLPALTAAQQEALDLVDQVAMELAIAVDQQPGDINFFNNLAILHARGAFTDGNTPQKRRHSTRLIFRDDSRGWDIPPPMQADWDKYYNHDQASEIFQLHPRPWEFTMNGHD